MIEGLRAWARTHTEEGRYSPVGIAFHWVMAALVLFQLLWGFYVGLMGVGGDKILAYQIHAAVGLPILILAIGRMAWRLIIPGPVNDADDQGVQTWIAHVIHYLFYLCFFGLPLSGWVMWSAYVEPGPLQLAGLISWPLVPLDGLPLEQRWAIMDMAEDVHTILVWLLVFTVPLHVGAALKHHFWDRHDVLRGMLPEVPDEEDPQKARRHKPREPKSPTRSAAG
jgi:cytochrome b561